MKVIIGGASGLIGRSLQAFFRAQGADVSVLTRNIQEKTKPHTIYWSPEKGILDPQKLEGCDLLINLAGDSLMGRWSKAKKIQLTESRVLSTRLLAQTIEKLVTPPKVWIQASAVGFYGARPEKEVDEWSPKGTGFLADLCAAWEKEAVSAKVRVIRARFSIVLSEKGGMLQQLLPLFRWGLGGKLGDGLSWMSWVELNEISQMMMAVYTHPEISGAVNFTTPNPVQNQEFTKVLAQLLNVPAILPAPEWALRLFMGERADQLILSSLRVRPQKLIDIGYPFQYPHIKEGLIAALGEKRVPHA